MNKFKDAVQYSLSILRKQLEEVEEQLDLDSDNMHKPHLVEKRKKLLEAIEQGERLLK